MSIRVIRQIRHDRYEALLDGQVRDYLSLSRLVQAREVGDVVTWDIKRPAGFDHHAIGVSY